VLKFGSSEVLKLGPSTGSGPPLRCEEGRFDRWGVISEKSERSGDPDAGREWGEGD